MWIATAAQLHRYKLIKFRNRLQYILRGRSAAVAAATAQLSGYDLLYTHIGYLTSTRRRAASYVIPLTNCVSERPRRRR